CDPRDCEWRAVGPECRLCGDVRAAGTALYPAGEVAAGLTAAGVLHNPLGTPVDGTAEVRPAVPLVRRAWHRRCGLGSLGVLQEPGQTARRRYRGQVHGGGLDP